MKGYVFLRKKHSAWEPLQLDHDATAKIWSDSLSGYML